jgi:hypothetical protein
MYPSRELTALALRKVAVRQRIAVARWDCVSAASEAARPIVWIDRAVAQWRKISPFAKIAAVPLGILFGRRLMPGKSGLFGRLLRWAPVVLKAVQMFKARQQ